MRCFKHRLIDHGSVRRKQFCGIAELHIVSCLCRNACPVCNDRRRIVRNHIGSGSVGVVIGDSFRDKNAGVVDGLVGGECIPECYRFAAVEGIALRIDADSIGSPASVEVGQCFNHRLIFDLCCDRCGIIPGILFGSRTCDGRRICHNGGSGCRIECRMIHLCGIGQC